MAEWITAKEAAAILGVHVATIPKMLRRGALVRRPQRPILNRAEVIAYRNARLANQQQLAAARDRPRQPWTPSPPNDEHDWLRDDAAATVAGISRVALNARARRGQLPSEVSDRRRWYRRDHLELVMRAHAARRDRAP